ncbi:MAG: CCA tRNA nucleotidyltransferase [Acidimicrobiia bacterium]|nr:CCA tRNA nucleotidyltransferase [Acidimicrobiia bacterium]
MIPDRFSWLLDPELPVVPLAKRFEENGHRLFLVGGSVRDAFLMRESPDFDFTTDARPNEIRAIVAGWADALFEVGAAFGTIGVRKGEHHVEITTFRKEIYRDESRKPEVTFSDDIETDLSRRDFAVNAMALELPTLRLIDPYDGVKDLVAGVLRTPLAPQVSFGDDPLRMMRMYRFQAQYGFTPDNAAETAAEKMVDRLDIVSPERIRDELSKLLVAPRVAEGLEGITRSGLADHFLPELSALLMEQDPVHKHKDVLAHTIAVVACTRADLTLRLAALVHDIGKPTTRRFVDGGVTFHHHEVVGARMTKSRMTALRYPNGLIDDVSNLVFLHLRPHTLKMGWTDSAVRRYVRDAGHLLDELNELVRCDVTTANWRRASRIQEGIDELEERIDRLAEQEELQSIRPPIDGHEVMAILGIPPGPRVGEVMEMLLEKRLDDGPYSAEEAKRLVEEWGKD